MIIRATTKEELREVLNYMCAQLRQTRVRVDLPRMGPPLHTGYDTVSAYTRRHITRWPHRGVFCSCV